jgi:hypothetical protein
MEQGMKPRQLVRMHNYAVGVMTDSTRVVVGYGLRVAALIVAAILVLAACSGDSSGGPGVASVSSPGGSAASSPSAGGSSAQSAVAYSACMRNHGVRNFPDPQRSGQIPKGSAQELGVSTSLYRAAQRACQHLIPNTGDTVEQQQELQCAQTGNCPQAVVQQWMSGLRKLAQCLRTHGEPNWPDPIITSLAGHAPAPHFPYEQAGIDHHSGKVLNEVQRCVQITGFRGLPMP